MSGSIDMVTGTFSMSGSGMAMTGVATANSMSGSYQFSPVSAPVESGTFSGQRIP
jgi:hypothetical protein